MEISHIDWAIVVIYLLVVVGLGCWAGVSARRKGAKTNESEAGEYFMAAHTLKWPVIGLALFATNISCVHLVSLAQSGYDTGLLNGNFEWMAAFTLILLGFFFAPFYLKSKVATLPDFLERRYCRECRDMLAVVSIVAAVIFHIAFPLATGWLILHDIFGIEKWTCIFLMCALTAVYTVVGGLAAVAITETIQTVILLVGACVITWFVWHKTGGWTGMTDTLDVVNSAKSGASDGKLMSMLRPHGDESGMPWYAIFLGYPILGIWYWCADQTIVQRVLGAKSENDARVGSIFCGLIKILPVFIFIVPGLMLYTSIRQANVEGVAQARLVRTVTTQAGEKEYHVQVSGALANAQPLAPIVVKGDEKIDFSKLGIQIQGKEPSLIVGAGVPAVVEGQKIVGPEGAKCYHSKEVYGVMIRKLLPTGLLGLLAAALMAALMGNLSSASNSIATMVSYDLVKRFKPNVSDGSLVLIGRVATLVAIGLGISLVPLLDRYESIFNGLNEIIAHMAPPITCVFLLGVFWPSASAKSAKWTMWLGSLMGVVVFAITKCTSVGWIALEKQPSVIKEVLTVLKDTPFMMMAFYMCVACVVMQVVFTQMMPKQADEDVQQLYWPSPMDALKSEGWSGLLNYKVMAALVVVVMVGLYGVFA